MVTGALNGGSFLLDVSPIGAASSLKIVCGLQALLCLRIIFYILANRQAYRLNKAFLTHWSTPLLRFPST